jgi:hypothetical protein
MTQPPKHYSAFYSYPRIDHSIQNICQEIHDNKESGRYQHASHHNGKSNFSNASTVTFPIPFHPKIYSTKKAPASNSANQPVIAVITGFNALRNA